MINIPQTWKFGFYHFLYFKKKFIKESLISLIQSYLILISPKYFLENIKINDSIKLEVVYPFFDEKLIFSKSNGFEFKNNYFSLTQDMKKIKSPLDSNFFQKIQILI